MTALPPLLHSDDLPAAELGAMRLDGELFAIEDGYSPIDVPFDAAQRARSLAPLCRGRLIVALRSAAWVWGAQPAPPSRHELCSSLGARARPIHPSRVTVREVVIAPEETTVHGGVTVTSPVRTVTDLARHGEHLDLVRTLLQVTGTRVEDCIDAIAARRGLPDKRRALALLGRC